MKKAILQINTFINSRSTGHIAEEIGDLVIKHGWDSYIGFGRDEHFSVSTKIHIGNEFDVLIHGLHTRFLDNHGLASKIVTKKFIDIIKQISPDIIHLHNIHGYYLNYKILFDFLSKANIPVIWTLHDCWTFTGHCAYYDYIKCKKWQDGCFHCPLLKSYPRSFFDRSSKNWLDKRRSFTSLDNLLLVPVSNWLSKELSCSFLKDIPKKVIFNGVNLAIFKPVSSKKKQLGLNEKFIILGAANVWEKRKGLYDFIELSKYIASDMHIILIGLDEKQIKKLPENIMGFKRTEDVKSLVDFYSTADVCLNLSSEETFGMTTVEAFACGTPGIVYNATASPELITSDTGFVVEAGDVKNLYNSILKIKNKGKSFYSKACIDRARMFYDMDKNFLQYIDLYQKLLSK